MATEVGYDPKTGVMRYRITNATQQTDPTPSGHTTWDVNGQNPVTVPLTSAETDRLAAQDAAVASDLNQATIRQQAQGALAGNRTYVGIASPTNAQVAAQVKALSQQINGVIRLLLNQFDGTN